MPGLGGTLYFGGTEILEPTGRDDLIAGGIDPDDAGDEDDDEYDSEEPKAYENPQTGERCLKRAVSPSADGQAALKRYRVLGGKAAIPKPVLANYDSDDGRIIELKQQGYTDSYICQRMAQEGRMSYVAKTISSRWLRLRKAIKEAEDNKLDDELSDWHEGEDHKLKTYVDRMEEETKADMQKVQDRKWAKISEQMAKAMGIKKYTAKACLERFGAVEDGTALLPIELDPDPEGRKVKREVRIAEAKERRAEQVAEAQRIEDEKRKHLEEKKLKSQETNRARILMMQEKEALKAEEERVKSEKRDTIEKQKEGRKAAARDAKLWAEWEKKKHATELDIYKKLTGKRMPGQARCGGRRKPGSKRQDSLDDDNEHGDDGEEYEGLSDDDDAEMADDESEEDIEGDTGSKAGSSSNTKASKGRDGGSGGISGTSNGAEATKKSTRAITPLVTEETLLNPRSIMAADELEALLFNRQMPRRGANETHPQLVARLAAADATLATQELDDLLRKFWDKGKGSKVAKVRRLQNHEANASAAGLDGVKSTDLEFKKGYEGYVGEYSCWIEDDDEEMVDEEAT